MTIALITGGRDFCEQRPGADHMGERRALGFALDWVKPSRVMAMAGEDGPSRLAAIWCERRGVDFSAEVRQQPEIVVAFPGASQRAIDRANELGIDIYEVNVAVPVFVFGSNLAGRHGKGAALWAKENRGAIYGVGEGRQGGSYAIPTKDGSLKTLPLDRIEIYVERFKAYAGQNPTTTFQLTPIGCGLAGYAHMEIAPMFRDSPENVIIPPEFAT